MLWLFWTAFHFHSNNLVAPFRQFAKVWPVLVFIYNETNLFALSLIISLNVVNLFSLVLYGICVQKRFIWDKDDGGHWFIYLKLWVTCEYIDFSIKPLEIGNSSISEWTSQIRVEKNYSIFAWRLVEIWLICRCLSVGWTRRVNAIDD